MLSEKPWKLDGMIFVSAGIFFGLSYFALLEAAVEQMLGKARVDENSLLYLAFGTLGLHGTILVVTALFLHLRRISWGQAFGFSTPGPGRSIALGILAAVVFLPIGLALQSASIWIMEKYNVAAPDQQAVASLKHAASWVNQAYLAGFSVFIAPVAEEVLFRGILYSGIKQSGYPRVALWGTALAFAAIHLNLKIFLPMVFLGLSLAWLYEKTNNLLTPIIAHATFNSVNLVILYFGDHVQTVINKIFHLSVVALPGVQ